MARRLALTLVLLLVTLWAGSGSLAPAAAQTWPGQDHAPRGPAFAQTAGPLTTPDGHAHILPRPDNPRREAAAGAAGSLAGSSNVTYHNGRVMTSPVTTYTVFWLGTSSSQHFQSDGNDSNYENLVDAYFSNVNGSSFYSLLAQYGTPSPLGSVATTFGGSWVDTTNAYPHAGTNSDPLYDADIQAEVGRAISHNHWQTGLGAMVFVYTGLNIQSCYDSSRVDCTFTDYCAYHSSYADTSGNTIVYANMPDTPGNCTPTDINGHGITPNNNQAADDVIDVTSHEDFEAVSDPNGDAWLDSSGEEIGDKCAWQFGQMSSNPSRYEGLGLFSNGSDIALNGHPFILQSEWSNQIGNCSLGGISISGTISGTTTTTPIAASVGGASCGSGDAFTLRFGGAATLNDLQLACGAAGQAVTFTVNGAAAGLRTSTGATCLADALDSLTTSVTLLPGGTPNTSCGTSGGGGSCSGTPNTGPAAPGQPSFSNVTATSATASWSAPATFGTDANGCPATGIGSYTIAWTPVSVGSPGSTTSNTTNANLTGLTAGASYHVTVTATNSAGVAGSASPAGILNTLTPVCSGATGTPNTPPSAPGTPTFTNVTSSGATANWTAASGGYDANGCATSVSSYTVTWAPAGGGTAQSATTSGLSEPLSGLASATSYSVSVTATDSAGQTGPAASAILQTAGAGTPPGAFTVSARAFGTAARVIWTAPSAGTTASGGAATITGYKVVAVPQGSGSSPSISVGSATRAVILSGLTPGVMYTFQVTATNSAGLSTTESSSPVLADRQGGAGQP